MLGSTFSLLTVQSHHPDETNVTISIYHLVVSTTGLNMLRPFFHGLLTLAGTY